MLDARRILLAVTLVLLAAALSVMAALYLDLRHQYTQLETENRRLEAQQVLLMVPDAQAEALADWLATHPDIPRHWIEKHRDNLVPEAAEPALSVTATPSIMPPSPRVLSENDKGVKVIALPHGGIRVTTADPGTHANTDTRQ